MTTTKAQIYIDRAPVEKLKNVAAGTAGSIYASVSKLRAIGRDALSFGNMDMGKDLLNIAEHLDGEAKKLIDALAECEQVTP